MKYENFAAATELVRNIKYRKKLIEDLNHPEIDLKLMTRNYTVMTIGAYKSCEHSHYLEAIGFVEVIKSKYEEELTKMMAELELL